MPKLDMMTNEMDEQLWHYNYSVGHLVFNVVHFVLDERR